MVRTSSTTSQRRLESSWVDRGFLCVVLALFVFFSLFFSWSDEVVAESDVVS